MLRVGVVLSGSGVFDGSEIHESVLTLLALDRSNAQAVCVAPNKNQSEVINHLTGQVAKESRNVLVESARIARGQIKDLRDVHAADLDAVILPGGFGAVKNLSSFCWNGENCWVDGEVSRLLREMVEAKKPIGATCIAPAVLAKALGNLSPRLTIGTDKATAETLEKTGAKHEEAQADEIVVDEKNQIVTTPAYMTAGRITEVADGIERLVEAVIRRAKARAKAIADSATSRVNGKNATSKRQAADSATSRVVESKSNRVSKTASRAARPATRRKTVRA